MTASPTPEVEDTRLGKSYVIDIKDKATTPGLVRVAPLTRIHPRISELASRVEPIIGKRVAMLIHPDVTLTGDDVRMLLKGRQLRAATLPELVAFVADHPDLCVGVKIVALGSRYQLSSFAEPQVPIIDGTLDGLQLSYVPVSLEDDHYYLGVEETFAAPPEFRSLRQVCISTTTLRSIQVVMGSATNKRTWTLRPSEEFGEKRIVTVEARLGPTRYDGENVTFLGAQTMDDYEIGQPIHPRNVGWLRVNMRFVYRMGRSGPLASPDMVTDIH